MPPAPATPRNHWILEPDGRERAPVVLGDVFLAHLPFRSVEQFLAKVINGWLAYKLAHGGELRAPDMATFYTPGERGYTDWPLT